MHVSVQYSDNAKAGLDEQHEAYPDICFALDGAEELSPKVGRLAAGLTGRMADLHGLGPALRRLAAPEQHLPGHLSARQAICRSPVTGGADGPRLQVLRGPGWAFVVQLQAVGGLALPRLAAHGRPQAAQNEQSPSRPR